MLDGLREIDLGVVPSPSGGGLLLLHFEEGADCLVAFMGFDPVTRSNPVGLATFRDCQQSIFGYPNDEAWAGLPEANYGFFEVTESVWDQELTMFNQREFPGSLPSPDLRHYFMASHDSSAQVLARGLTVERFDLPYRAVVAKAVERILS